MSMSVEPRGDAHNAQEVQAEAEAGALPRRQWRGLLKRVLLAALALWLVHVLLLGLAVWHMKRAVERQEFRIERLSIDATAQDSIEIRAKAGFAPSLWFYSFFFNIYKPVTATASFPGLGVPEDVVSVTVPAFNFGHEQTVLNFTDTPIQVKLLDRLAVEEALSTLAKHSDDLLMLHGHDLKAHLKLHVSLFTMTLWLPIWLDRTLSIPLSIPIRRPVKKPRGGAKQPKVVEPQQVRITEQDGHLLADIQLRVDYDALPLPIPIEVSLPELLVDVGIASNRVVSVRVPRQVMDRHSPHIRLQASLMQQDTAHIADLVARLAGLDWSVPLFVSASRTGQECMLQRFVQQSVSLRLPFRQLLQLGLNGRSSMKPVALPAQPTTEQEALSAHKLVDLRVESIEGTDSSSALIKASAIITPPDDPPLHAVSGLPQISVVVAHGAKELLRATASARAHQNALHVAVEAGVFDLASVTRALMAAAAGPAAANLPDAFKEQLVSLRLESSHATLQSLFDKLVIDVGMGRAVLRAAADINLLEIPEKVMANPPVLVPATSKTMEISRMPIRHAVKVSHVHSQSEFKLLADIHLHAQRVFACPYISVTWPSISLAVSHEYQDIVSATLSAGKLEVSVGDFGPGLTKVSSSGGPIHAKVSLGGAVEKSGAALGRLVEQMMASPQASVQVAISAASTGRPMFTQFIPIPPPLQKTTTPAAATTESGQVTTRWRAFFGIHAVSSDGVTAALGLEDLQCPAQSANHYSLSLDVDLPRLAARVATNQGPALVEASVPRLCVKGRLENDQLCDVQIRSLGSDGRVSSKGTLPVVAKIVADPGQVVDSLALSPIESIAVKGADDLCMARFINSMDLHIPVTRDGGGCVGGCGDGNGGGETEKSIDTPPPPLDDLDPLDVSLSVRTESNTFDISAAVRIPAASSHHPDPRPPSPILSVKQGAITVVLGFSDTEYLEIALSRVLIPIKLDPGMPTSSSTPYTPNIQLNIRGRCGAASCDSASLHTALSRLMADKWEQPVHILASVSPFDSDGADLARLGSVPSGTLSKVLNRLAEQLKDIRQVSLGGASPAGQEAVDGGGSAVPNWLDLHVRVDSVPGSPIGRLPCPFAAFCSAISTPLDSLLRVTVSAPTLLSTLLASVDLSAVFKVIDIPTPSGLKLTVSHASDIGVKVSANGDTDLAAVRVNPFMVSSDPDSCTDVSVDVFVNGGTSGLHRLLQPILLLAMPAALSAPKIDGKELEQLPVSLQLKGYSDNLLSAVLAGAVFEVSLGNVLGSMRASSEHKDPPPQESTVKLDLDVDAEEQARITVRGIEPAILPPGIHVDLGSVRATILRDRRPVVTASLNLDLQPGENVLEPRIVLVDGRHLGQLIGDVLSEDHVELLIQVHIGSASVELPVSYQQDQQQQRQLLVALMDAVMDSVRKENTFVNQTVPAVDPDAPDLFNTHLIPDLPVAFDSALVLVKRLLRSLYRCLNEEDALLWLKSRLSVKQSVLPPVISGLQAGLVGLRLGFRLDSTSSYYYGPREASSGVRRDNFLTIGPARCVPQHSGAFDTSDYLQCARSRPLKLLGQHQGLHGKKLRRRPRGIISNINRALQKVVNAATRVAEALGVSRPLVQNFSSLMQLIVGEEPDDPSDGSSVAVALTYADARHLIDQAVNEGGMCMEVPLDRQGFAEVSLMGADKSFNLHIPVGGFALPVPASLFADPCNSKTRCQLEHASVVEPGDVSLDPLGNWSMEFSFSSKHPRVSVGVETLSKAGHHHMSINFIPRHVAAEPNALKLFREIPYLSRPEHLFESIAQLASRFTDDQDSEETFVGTGRRTNAISLELDGAVLHHFEQPAIRVNGVFPPLADSVRARLGYSQALKRLVVECWDGSMDPSEAPKMFRSIFPVDIAGALQVKPGDWLSIAINSDAKQKFLLSVHPPALAQTRLFSIGQVDPGRRSSIALQLWDACSRPLTLMHSRLQVMLRNGADVVQGDAVPVDGVFIFDFVPTLPGVYHLSLRLGDNDPWTVILEQSVYVRQNW